MENPSISRLVVTDSPVCLSFPSSTSQSEVVLQFGECYCVCECPCPCQCVCPCPCMCECPGPGSW